MARADPRTCPPARRLARLALPAIVGLVTLLLLADFARRQFHPDDIPPPGISAVVFTGQYDRIETALALFDAGRIGRLLISGVNRPAGLSVATLADQFHASPKVRRAIAEGRILLSPDARDTGENAAEAACWYRTGPAGEGLLLITSSRHMPRASLALQSELSGQTRLFLQRPTTAPSADDPAFSLRELAAFAVTRIRNALTGPQTDRAHLSLCRDLQDHAPGSPNSQDR